MIQSNLASLLHAEEESFFLLLFFFTIQVCMFMMVVCFPHQQFKCVFVFFSQTFWNEWMPTPRLLVKYGPWRWEPLCTLVEIQTTAVGGGTCFVALLILTWICSGRSSRCGQWNVLFEAGETGRGARRAKTCKAKEDAPTHPSLDFKNKEIQKKQRKKNRCQKI